MIKKQSSEQPQPEHRPGIAMRAARRCLDATVVGLAAGGVLGAIDAAGYLAGFGAAEWPQIVSFSVVLSTAIYLPATLTVTLWLVFIPRLRRDGALEALRLTVLLAAALVLTNLNRLLVAMMTILSTGKLSLRALKSNEGLRYSPLLLLTTLLITLFVGFGMWRLRRIWKSRAFVRLVQCLAGFTVVGLVSAAICLDRTSYRLNLSRSSPAVARSPGKPHVIILVLDAARADALSCYGGPAGTTPHLDRLAERGTLFEDVLSPGAWTLPSHASIFTGLAASEHGVGWGNLWLEDRFTTLAERLQSAGYRTVIVSCNPLLNQGTNLFQGFAEVHQQSRWLFRYNLLGGMDVAEALCGLPLRQWFPGTWGAHLTDRAALSANVLAEKAIARAASTGQPLLLFLNYIDSHMPYVPPRGYREKLSEPEFEASYRLDQDYVRRVYPYMLGGKETFSAEDLVLLRKLSQDAVSYLDARVGEITAALDHYGLTQDTLLIVTSDHGDNIGEHGLLDHHFCVYQTLVRVPLIVHFPGRLRPGRVKTPVQTTDIYPTVLAAAGINAASNPRVARNLLQAVDDDAPRPRVAELVESLFDQVSRYQKKCAPGGYRRFLRRFRAIELDGYKLIHSSAGDHELYYLPEDPGELNNRIESEPERAEALHKELQQWLGAIDRYRPPRKVGQGSELSEELTERLRALGYL